MASLSTSKGNYGELHIEALLRLQGFQTSRPTGADCPYDLIVDKDNVLYKCQIKSATSKKGLLNLKCTTFTSRSVRNDYANVDNFLVCDLLNSRVFILPNPGASVAKLSLHYDVPSLAPYIVGKRWIAVYENAWQFFGATFGASDLYNKLYELRTISNILRAQQWDLCGFGDTFTLKRLSNLAELVGPWSIKKFLTNMGLVCYPYSYEELMDKLDERIEETEGEAQEALQGVK